MDMWCLRGVPVRIPWHHSDTFDYLGLQPFADHLYEEDAWMFADTYPLICDYRGEDTYSADTATHAGLECAGAR